MVPVLVADGMAGIDAPRQSEIGSDHSVQVNFTPSLAVGAALDMRIKVRLMLVREVG